MFNENEKILILDTETTNSIEEPIMYDLGFAVVDIETEEVIEAHSYVIAEIFLDKEFMSSAYYSEKVPQYWEDIKAGKRKLVKFSTARNIVCEICKKYGIKKVFAHNMRFDYRSTNLSQRYLTCSKYRFFFPYGIEFWDTLKMARVAFKQDDNYGKFCLENGFMTKRNQRQYTAEVLYRYLTNDVNFVEEHKGLEDVLIEKEILFECLRRGCECGRLWE